ncbi:MAG: class I SAM-dependent methyltransferase [Lachnospiraceae bacterium]|nr:class I SAM-dependent methyltransferase [Lachnospiraceae bacterium]
MSNYNFEMDYSEESSVGIIFKKIKPHSIVLEFGCASGRMTKAMQTKLQCDVYIVEYNVDDYNQAIEYAKDGVCGDIQSFEWLEKFADIEFDYIIFADVLEHLTLPGKVLQMSKQLLKEDGEIILSIPNVTHNDVIVKAIDERIDYTKVGLLDETHVHFWGKKNIEEFARNNSLYVKNVEATYANTKKTEQFDSKRDIELENIFLYNLLKQRGTGEVYQFVVTLKKQEVSCCDSIKAPSLKSMVFLNYGNGFNEDDVLEVEAKWVKKDTYEINCVIDDVKDVCGVRFDPVENQACVVKHVEFRQNNMVLPLSEYNGVLECGEILFTDYDPKIVVDKGIQNEGPIILSAQFIVMGEEYLSAFLRRTYRLDGLLEQTQGQLEQTQGQLEQTQNILAAVGDRCQKLQVLVCQKDDRLIEYEKMILNYENLRVIRIRKMVVRVLKKFRVLRDK